MDNFHHFRDTTLGSSYPEIEELTRDRGFDTCAGEFVSLDGRTIRKTVANALASNIQVALNPGSVTLSQLAAAAKSAQTNKKANWGK